ncbi:MAG: AI-2E family transporter [Ignavibacteriaceae bacterium]|nr:AI-2E family transporter [Ignavibacteriaceae bacterium]
MTEPANKTGKSFQVMVIFASFVIIVAGMKAAESIIVPFLLAMFISIIALPPFLWLQQKKVPRGLALVILVLTFLTFIFLIGLLIGTSITDFTSNLPLYEQKLQNQTQAIVSWLIEKKYIESNFQISNAFKPGVVLDIAGNVFNQLSNLFTNGFLILLTVIFMMLEVSSLPKKINEMFANPEASLSSIKAVTQNINKYITLKTIMNLCNALLVTIFLFFMGVDYYLLWGLLAFMLNYIPTIGSFFALLPPALLALVQFGFVEAIAVVIGFIIINTLVGNIIEPRFMGKGLGLSTLVVFLSLIFWGWVLGPIGMLLSVPLTITIKIALDSSDETRWLAILLGPENTE